MRQLDIAGIVLEDEGSCALQDARAAAGEACRMTPAGDFLTARFDADETHARIVDETVEDSNRVAAAADAGDYDIGQAAGLLEHLTAGFAADHRLELAHHQRIRM